MKYICSIHLYIYIYIYIFKQFIKTFVSTTTSEQLPCKETIFFVDTTFKVQVYLYWRLTLFSPSQTGGFPPDTPVS